MDQARAQLFQQFEGYARAAGAEVTTVADEAAAAAAISSIASAAGEVIKCAAAVRASFPGLCRALEEAGHHLHIAEETAEQKPNRSELAGALAGGIGIVLAQAGIAETGSLVLADDALAPRLLSMLADVCVVLLPSWAILPGLDEAGALVDGFQRTGHYYVSLVTGPSRTADIERVLTIGVQGPKELLILVIGG